MFGEREPSDGRGFSRLGIVEVIRKRTDEIFLVVVRHYGSELSGVIGTSEDEERVRDLDALPHLLKKLLFDFFHFETILHISVEISAKTKLLLFFTFPFVSSHLLVALRVSGHLAKSFPNCFQFRCDEKKKPRRRITYLMEKSF